MDISDVHVQYLSDNTDRWKQWMFKKKTWGNIHLESVVSTSWKLESEGLSSCNIPLLCLKVILFYSKHIFNLWKAYAPCYERMTNDEMML